MKQEPTWSEIKALATQLEVSYEVKDGYVILKKYQGVNGMFQRSLQGIHAALDWLIKLQCMIGIADNARKRNQGMSKSYERGKQRIGRYEIFLRGKDADVIMRSGNIERDMTAREALAFLAWLNEHKSELYSAVRLDEQTLDETD